MRYAEACRVVVVTTPVRLAWIGFSARELTDDIPEEGWLRLCFTHRSHLCIEIILYAFSLMAERNIVSSLITLKTVLDRVLATARRCWLRWLLVEIHGWLLVRLSASRMRIHVDPGHYP